jgi:hypothetical protein
MATALDRLHDTGKFGQYAVARGVDNPSAEVAHHRQHHRLVALEVAYRARFVNAHERAVIGDIGGQDRRKPSLKALLSHVDRSPGQSDGRDIIVHRARYLSRRPCLRWVLVVQKRFD